jgi:hemin uptake protein HemP
MNPWPLSATSSNKPEVPAIAPGNEAQRRQVRSTDLFGNCREVLIEHAGEFYSLRRTSKGKLILTK